MSVVVILLLVLGGLALAGPLAAAILLAVQLAGRSPAPGPDGSGPRSGS